MAPEVWSFIETDGDRLQAGAPGMAAEARRTADIFGAKAAGILFGNNPAGFAESLQHYGLIRLYCGKSPMPLSPENIATGIEAAAMRAHPQFILFAGTPLGTDVGARVAAGLKRGFISQCTDFSRQDDMPVARKRLYGGKADAFVTWTTAAPYVAGIALEALEAIKTKTPARPEVVTLELPTVSPRCRLEKCWSVDRSQLDLSEAGVVIGVGKGVAPSAMPLVEELAGRIKGVIGGTRMAVYEGMVPLARQIGTTGKWLDCNLYIALGISGAPQHVMGIKSVKKIIAVNITREAPIFKYAHLGIVGEWHEVVHQLITLIDTEPERKI